jgi:hypothetical protein
MELQPGPKSKATGKARRARIGLENAVERALECLHSNGWDGAGPVHLVGLYAWLHAQFYEVPAEELYDSKVMLAALGAAKRTITVMGGAPEAVKFVAWTWNREKQMRAKGKALRRRITWQLQFACRAMQVDYRVAKQSEALR